MAGAAATAGAAGGWGWLRCGCGWFVRGFLFIIGFVEAGAFENHAGTAADQACQLVLAALRAFGQLFVGHGLQFFKFMAAGLAFILIGRHMLPKRFL